MKINKISVKQSAKEIKNTIGVKIEPAGESQGRSLFSKIIIGVAIGLLVLIIWRVVTTYIWVEDSMKKEEGKAKHKIEDINVEQKGDNLSDVTGVEMSNNPNDTELGKVKVHQEGKNLKNVTGMKMKFDGHSGEVELKDKVEIKQQSPHGQTSVIFNADQPGVKIFINKQSTKKPSEGDGDE